MTVLQSDKIILREFHPADNTAIAELCNNKKIWNNLRDFIPHPYKTEDADYFIEFCRSEMPQHTFLIEYNGCVAGSIGLVQQEDIYKHSAELGYWIGEPYWGKGIATKAVKLIVGYGFGELGLTRIFSSVFDHNKASQKVLEKNGFTLECISRKSVIKNNILLDEYKYSILNHRK